MPKKVSRASATTVPLSVHCGVLPDGSAIDDFHYPPRKVHHRKAEGKYWKRFEEMAGVLDFATGMGEPELAVCSSWDISVSDALMACEKQLQFFKSVDSFQYDPVSLQEMQGAGKDHFEQRLESDMALLRQSVGHKVIPSDTVVVEAARRAPLLPCGKSRCKSGYARSRGRGSSPRCSRGRAASPFSDFRQYWQHSVNQQKNERATTFL